VQYYQIHEVIIDRGTRLGEEFWVFIRGKVSGFEGAEAEFLVGDTELNSTAQKF
jgi:hypothetical protein